MQGSLRVSVRFSEFIRRRNRSRIKEFSIVVFSISFNRLRINGNNGSGNNIIFNKKMNNFLK